MDDMTQDGGGVGAKKTTRRPRLEALVQLGERIRDERRRRGYTQAELAESLNLSVAYVSLIERGGRNPPYTTVVEIARVMGYSPRQLLQG